MVLKKALYLISLLLIPIILYAEVYNSNYIEFKSSDGNTTGIPYVVVVSSLTYDATGTTATIIQDNSSIFAGSTNYIQNQSSQIQSSSFSVLSGSATVFYPQRIVWPDGTIQVSSPPAGGSVGDFIDTSASTQTKTGGFNVLSNVGIGTTSSAYKLNLLGKMGFINSDSQTDSVVFSTINYLNSNSFDVWTATESVRSWFGVAMSANGAYQSAVNNSGSIYVSYDYGKTWTAKDTSRNWQAIAMSADGSTQAATVLSGNIYVSTNSGNTWSARDSSRSWAKLAVSVDGRTMTAVASADQIYVSTNSGNTWNARGPIKTWRDVCMSSSAIMQTAAASSSQLYISSDSGSTWVAKATTNAWRCVDMSADGSTQTAAIFGGQIYTSNDYGNTWSVRDSSRNWVSLSMSTDGVRQSAVVLGGQIYVSTDSGNTWNAKDSNRSWQGISLSANGYRQTAVASSDQIYLSIPDSTKSLNITGTGLNVSSITVSAIIWPDGTVQVSSPQAGGSGTNFQPQIDALNLSTATLTARLDNLDASTATITGLLKATAALTSSQFAAAFSSISTLQTATGTLVSKNNDFNVFRTTAQSRLDNLSISTAILQLTASNTNYALVGTVGSGGLPLPGGATNYLNNVTTGTFYIIPYSSFTAFGAAFSSLTVNGLNIVNAINSTYSAINSWTLSQSTISSRLNNLDTSTSVLSVQSNKFSIYISTDFSNDYASGGQTYLSGLRLGTLNRSLRSFGQTWNGITNTTFSWTSIAMSDDGRIITGVYGSTMIVGSMNYGVTWNTLAMNAAWNAAKICMSGDGKYQLITNFNNVIRSVDYGVTWSTMITGASNLNAASMSDDGKFQTIADQGGNIYASTDYGATWTSRTPSDGFRSLSVSGEGKYQSAVAYNGQMYVSSDYGFTWSTRSILNSWTGISVSFDGKYQTAVAQLDLIYVSTSFGQNWTTKGLSKNWINVAMTKDGRYQTAVSASPSPDGLLYCSNDYGNTWSLKLSSFNFVSNAISGGGKIQVAALTNGQLWISSTTDAFGMGTPNPTSMLDIFNGSITIRGANAGININGTDVLSALSSNSNYLVNVPTGTVYNIQKSSMNISSITASYGIYGGTITAVYFKEIGTSTSAYLSIWNSTSSWSAQQAFMQNVGIGTVSPLNALDIFNGSVSVRGGSIGIGTTTPSSSLDINNGSITIRGTNAGLNILQGTFTVTTNGNVGINTISPTAKLHIFEIGSSTISQNNLFRISTGTTNLMLVTATSTIIAQEPWHYIGATGEPAFSNSWVNYDASAWTSARYMKDSQGFVHVEGMIKNGTINTAYFTLPVGYRPAKAVALPIGVPSGVSYCYVNADGTIQHGGGSTTWNGFSLIFWPN